MDVLLTAVAFQVLAGIAACLCSKWPRAATVLGAGGSCAGLPDRIGSNAAGPASG